MQDMWPINLTIIWVIALLQGCVLIALYADLGRVVFRHSSRYKPLITEDGPPLQRPLPSVSGQDARSRQPVAAAQYRGRNLVLLFISPGCGPSGDLLQALRQRHRGWRDDAAFLVVMQALPSETLPLFEGVTDVAVVADPDGQIMEACGIQSVPFGILVDAWGYVRMKGIVNTRDQLAGLIAGQGRPLAGLSWEPVPEGDPSSSVPSRAI